MIRYVDTSAAAKLVLAEPDAVALREAARSWQDDDLVAGQIMATELRRLTARVGVPSEVADAALGVVELVDVERDDFVVAGMLPPATARTLDALHVAVALRLEVDAIVTYDRRQADLARAQGLEVVTPT